MAITESDRIRWLSHREICSERRIGAAEYCAWRVGSSAQIICFCAKLAAWRKPHQYGGLAAPRILQPKPGRGPVAAESNRSTRGKQRVDGVRDVVPGEPPHS